MAENTTTKKDNQDLLLDDKNEKETSGDTTTAAAADDIVTTMMNNTKINNDTTNNDTEEVKNNDNNDNNKTTTTVEEVSRDEMLDIVRAIKFAKPESSMREVHREITQVLSTKESFEFLSSIPLKDVQKVWKKACSSSSNNTNNTNSNNNILPNTNKDEVLKLYTVGNVMVKTLIEDYSQAMATNKIVQQSDNEAPKDDDNNDLNTNYVHVFLDVPADRTGQRPHQALINFNNNNNTSNNKTKKNKKKNKKKGVVSSNDNNDIDNDNNNIEIVKIQLAAPAGDDKTKYPMLIYNHDRSSKTFIHPEEDDTKNNIINGYDCIQSWIQQTGLGGALGITGGIKAYFYAHRTTQKHGSDILSIDITQLASPQNW